ncbi:phage tail protein [Azoarcus indigens]|uniref:Tail tube protein n=1 Tax=Azoarcus indigens TaxID=29545 RepID=A0A4R6DYL2_9RHOO|nr:phage tail tube protein [Azoarcus indigens]NMG64883.1 phage tail protein [Azoarcus indigens]TDN50421.1 tail tube protein [Azoarcus indigens]
MGQKIAGTAYVKADGTQFTVTGAVEAPVSPYIRESIAPGVFKEEDRVPFVVVEVAHTADLPIETLAEATNMTVTVEFKNGRVYTLTGAYLVEEPSTSSDEGKIQYRFEGVKGVWQ